MNTHASCQKCTFFDTQNPAQAMKSASDGLCRYNPPVTQPGPSEHGLWPVVSTGDWCGHFSGQSAAVSAAE